LRRSATTFEAAGARTSSRSIVTWMMGRSSCGARGRLATTASLSGEAILELASGRRSPVDDLLAPKALSAGLPSGGGRGDAVKTERAAAGAGSGLRPSSRAGAAGGCRAVSFGLTSFCVGRGLEGGGMGRAGIATAGSSRLSSGPHDRLGVGIVSIRCIVSLKGCRAAVPEGDAP